jgi:hypothetical protein
MSSQSFGNPKETQMSEPKRAMRPHEKGLAALWALLIGVITLSAVRTRVREWLKQRKSQ